MQKKQDGAATPLDLVGPAGEALVAFDLLRRGIRVHQSAPRSSFDLVAELANGRLVRVEVKTTQTLSVKGAECRGKDKPRQTGRTKTAYMFRLAGHKKSANHSPNRGKYSPVEVFAFVALDIQKVLYYRWFDMNSSAVTKWIGASVFDEADRNFLDCFGLEAGV